MTLSEARRGVFAIVAVRLAHAPRPMIGKLPDQQPPNPEQLYTLAGCPVKPAIFLLIVCTILGTVIRGRGTRAAVCTFFHPDIRADRRRPEGDPSRA